MRTPTRNAGFSLVEVLIAVLILGVALAGLVQALSTALNSHKDSELQTAAALLAAGQIETLRAEGGLLDGTAQGECGAGLSLYRWRQSITAAGIDGLHDVAVVIENTRTGKEIYELRTLLFERPEDSGLDKGPGKRRDSRSPRRRGSRG